MYKSIRLATIAVVATVAFASSAANAQHRTAQSSPAARTLAVSPRVGAARAESDSDMPRSSGAQNPYMAKFGGGAPLCRPGEPIMFGDGLKHICQ